MFFTSLAYHAQEIYDVETVPTLRTKAYSSEAYKNIVIFSAPRTGSMLIYNIFKFLFEKDSQLLARHDNFNLNRVVLRTHRFAEFNLIDKESTLCIFTFRNPIDACISTFRICTRNPINPQELAYEFINRTCCYFSYIKSKEHEGLQVLKLKYEDSAGNLDLIFDKIEDHFHISIDPKDKELMRLCYSIENIEACIKGLKDFDEFLPISGFHGKHVTLQRYTPPADFLYWLNIYLQEFIPLIQPYGYFLDTSI